MVVPGSGAVKAAAEAEGLDRVFVDAGFEWRDEEVLNSGLQGGRGAAQHRGAFAQLEWQAEPALRLTGGLRGDHHSRFGSFWSPRAYAVWQAAPGWVLKGGVSRAPMTARLPSRARPMPKSARLAGSGTPTVCANPDAFLYWDYEHPTSALHAEVGRLALLAVPEPAGWSLLLIGLGGIGLMGRRRRH